MNGRPNILFILADQFRADALECVGGYGRTPALNALATQGAAFRRSATNSPECMPARFALATGLYPHQTGVWHNGPLTLAPSAPSWIRSLAEAGYRTSVFGKTHFHENAHRSRDLRDGLDLMRSIGLMDVDEIAGPRASRFVTCRMTDEWARAGLREAFQRDMAERIERDPLTTRPTPLGLEHYYDSYVGRVANEYLKSYDRPEPWFCWVSFAGPHEPWDTPAPYDKLHDPAHAPPAIPAYEDVKGFQGLLKERFRNFNGRLQPARVAALRASYAGNVTLIDDCIGSILETVRSRAEYDRTLIVFTSDHGEMNGDHGLVYKSNFLASAVDVPLIVRAPGSAASCRRPDALVELMDVGATILDYAGCPPLTGSAALSLRPVLDGQVTIHRSIVLAEYAHHAMVADGRYKVEFGPDGLETLLFDQQLDWVEEKNLVGTPASREPVERLRQAWLDRLAQTSRRVRVTL